MASKACKIHATTCRKASDSIMENDPSILDGVRSTVHLWATRFTFYALLLGWLGLDLLWSFIFYANPLVNFAKPVITIVTLTGCTITRI